MSNGARKGGGSRFRSIKWQTGHLWLLTEKDPAQEHSFVPPNANASCVPILTPRFCKPSPTN
jgi:hypothetical protein